MKYFLILSLATSLLFSSGCASIIIDRRIDREMKSFHEDCQIPLEEQIQYVEMLDEVSISCDDNCDCKKPKPPLTERIGKRILGVVIDTAISIVIFSILL